MQNGTPSSPTSAPPRTIRLLAVIADRSVREHLLGLLEQLATDSRLRGVLLLLDNLPSDASDPSPLVIQYLTEYFTSHPTDAAILLSDMLTENRGTFPLSRYEPTPFAKRCYERFRDRLYATVAVMEQRRRILDIDRTIHPSPDATVLARVLDLVTERLSYLARPTPTVLANPVTVRTLSRNQCELKRYFELRYRVYLPMGYLPLDTEDCESRMEMDWCDKKSIHIAAFEHLGVQERLVGTARVVTTAPVNGDDATLYHDLAGRDPVLQRRLNTALQLGLPVFDSQPAINDLMSELLARNELLGELSRVAVASSHRGAGLSQRLVDHAIEQAGRAGLSRLFLECLDIHEALYRKLGFARVSDMRGKVVGVDRTMIVMQLPLSLLAVDGRRVGGQTT